MGWWKLECDVELTDADIYHITEAIKEGYTEGEIVHEEEED